jgi:hypothetical protein
VRARSGLIVKIVSASGCGISHTPSWPRPEAVVNPPDGTREELISGEDPFTRT